MVYLGLGALFGVGLGISGMLFPEKILAFLNVTGEQWDPSLLFVMGGAVLSYGLIFRLNQAKLQKPAPATIDSRLLLGAALFGLGWGLSGFCPGPAIASLGSFTKEALFFVGAMLAGGLVAARL